MAKLTKFTSALLVVGAIAVSATSSTAASDHGSNAKSEIRGVYSSVRYNQESGDVLGMEVEVRATPQPTAVVTLCEGQCTGGKVWPALITGDTISFSVMEDLKDQDGRPVKPLKLNFVGQLKGNLLVVRVPDASEAPEERLMRVVHPKPSQTAQLGCGHTAC